MKIVLAYSDTKCLVPIELTYEEETRYILDTEDSEDDFSVVFDILKERGIHIDEFNPMYFIVPTNTK